MRVPELFRIKTGPLASDSSLGCNGAFFIPRRGGLIVIASDQGGWEHVSVSRSDKKIPGWYDLQLVKELFWGDSETVVQFHPKKSEHRSIGEVLHLWKKSGHEYELPPGIMVAPC